VNTDHDILKILFERGKLVRVRLGRGRRGRRSTVQFLEASDSSFDFPPLEELDLPVAQEYLAFGGEARVNLLLLLQCLQLLLLRLAHLGRQVLQYQFGEMNGNE